MTIYSHLLLTGDFSPSIIEKVIQKAVILLNINVGKLKNVKHAAEAVNVTETVDTAAYDYGELTFLTPVTFRGKMENIGDLLELSGRGTGALRLICSRCLKPYRWDFSVIVEEFYTNQQEIVDADEDGEINFFSGDEIDLMPQILKQIFLEIPMKLLCDPNCRGLCPHCGADLNEGDCDCDKEDIDIRLAGLKDLLKQMDKEV